MISILYKVYATPVDESITGVLETTATINLSEEDFLEAKDDLEQYILDNTDWAEQYNYNFFIKVEVKNIIADKNLYDELEELKNKAEEITDRVTEITDAIIAIEEYFTEGD